MRARFFRHLFGGMALGTAAGGVTLAALAWVIQPHATSLPWSFAFVGLFQIAAMGGVLGVATFLRANLKGESDDTGRGGPRLHVDDHPLVDEVELAPQPA